MTDPKPDPFFQPGPPRERITEDEMPTAEELPGVIAFLEKAGQEVTSDDSTER